MAIALENAAGEGASAHNQDALVVLLELFDQRDEVAVSADDREGRNVMPREGHLQRVERQVDVGAVLVAARRDVPLHHLHGVLRHLTALVAGAVPVAVSDFGHHLAALLERLKHYGDVKLLPQRFFDTNLDVVKINEYGEFLTFFVQLAPL